VRGDHHRAAIAPPHPPSSSCLSSRPCAPPYPMPSISSIVATPSLLRPWAIASDPWCARPTSTWLPVTSSRDGTVSGIGAFRDYLGRIPPTGKWQSAQWNREKQRAEIRGLVKFVLVPVKVVAHFGFDRRGKINNIYVGTKKKERG